MDFIIAVAIAVLSGLGLGGGGLFTVYLRLTGEYTQLAAQALNLLFFLAAAGSAVLLSALRGRIYWGAVTITAAFGLPASICGSALATFISGELLSRLFGAMLIPVGLYGIYRGLKKRG